MQQQIAEEGDVQLVYISSRKSSTDEQAVDDIKRRSEHGNNRRGITGMLLYTEQYFLQYLEGHHAVVDALYQRISTDPRHENVRLLQRKSIKNRDFSRWNLGVKHILDNEENQDLIALLNMLGQAKSVSEDQLDWFKLALK